MNQNDNPATPSQNKLILEYLMQGHKLTGIEALDMFGCFRLPSRINDLKNKGWVIKSERVLLPNGKRVAQYSIDTLASLINGYRKNAELETEFPASSEIKVEFKD